MADLAGTWVYTSSEPAEDKDDADDDGDTDEILGNWCESYTRTISMNDSTHGTFLEVYKAMHDYPDASGIPDWIRYTAAKGTVTLSGGVITLAETQCVPETATELDIATIDSSGSWTPSAYSMTDNCAIIDGKFFTEVFKRTGAGTGLEGIWLREFTSSDSIYRFKHTYTATAYSSESQTTTAGVAGAKYTTTYLYTVKSATSIHVKSGSEEWDQEVYLGTDVVALPKDCGGWVKQ